jgi:hypothetical protein
MRSPSALLSFAVLIGSCMDEPDEPLPPEQIGPPLYTEYPSCRCIV